MLICVFIATMIICIYIYIYFIYIYIYIYMYIYIYIYIYIYMCVSYTMCVYINIGGVLKQTIYMTLAGYTIYNRLSMLVSGSPDTNTVHITSV